MDLKQQIANSAEELCHRFQIKRLGVFGSVARGEENPESDIDLFAEFENPDPLTMPDRYFGLISEISEQFDRPVQLLTPRMVRNPFLRKSINQDLVILHG